jgi:hypothetical protein
MVRRTTLREIVNAKEKRRFIEQHLGGPREISGELRRFRKSALVFSRERPRMIEQHPQEWVAVYNGKVAATNKSLPRLLKKLDAAKIPRGEALIRFIDRTERTMILPASC